jgi:hypothetical protein
MRKSVLFAVLILTPYNVKAQLNNRLFEDRMALDSADAGRAFVGVNFMGFLRNDEYLHTIVEGYTLFGFQLNPYFSYHISPRVRFDAGVFAQKDFGNDDFSSVAPTLSVKVDLGHLDLIFGNLEGSLNHRLIEPLYDFERVMTDRLESGIQNLMMTDGLFIDGWMDWRNMIYLNDDEKEEFVVGLSAEKRVWKSGQTEVGLPLQATVLHRGGQIDVNPVPLITLFNLASGVTATRKSDRWLNEIHGSLYYAYYRDWSPQKLQAFDDGAGWYINAGLATRPGPRMMVSYWRGKEFIAALGGPLYQSVSVQYSDVVEPLREILLFRFFYDMEISRAVSVAARVEPLFDFGSRQWEYSYGVYVNYRDRYGLGKRRKK